MPPPVNNRNPLTGWNDDGEGWGCRAFGGLRIISIF